MPPDLFPDKFYKAGPLIQCATLGDNALDLSALQESVKLFLHLEKKLALKLKKTKTGKSKLIKF